MIGPVLYLELLLAGRRGNQALYRYAYGAWLLFQLLFFYVLARLDYLDALHSESENIRGVYGRFALNYLEFLVLQQVVMVALWTPTCVAGAITDEKSRGTLQYLLTAHLTGGELVLGKLLGRLAQVAVLLVADLPIIAFFGVFGGLNALVLLAVIGNTLVLMFAAAAASLLVSVWCRRTSDAVLSLYTVIFVGLAFLVGFDVARALTNGTPVTGVVSVLIHGLTGSPPGPAPAGTAWGWGTQMLLSFDSFLNFFRPLRVLEPALTTGNRLEVARRFAASLLTWGAFGGVCLGLASVRLRAAYTRQLEAGGSRQTRQAFVRPPVDDDPLRWKEQQVDGIAPLTVLRQVRSSLALTAVFVVTAASSCLLLGLSRERTASMADLAASALRFDLAGLAAQIDARAASTAFLAQAMLATFLASLVVGIRCSATVSGERERQTWEALLLTPLDTRQLIRGKLWGIYHAAFPYFAAYAAPAVVLAGFGGLGAIFWTLFFLPVAALAMYYVGAAGVYCSVRSRSSWRSLLATLGLSYVGGFVIYVCTTPGIFIVAGAVRLILIPLVDRILEDYGVQSNLTAGAGGLFDEKSQVAWMIASCVSLAVIFFGLSWLFVMNSEKRVADKERTRHWKDEALFRGGRPRLPSPPPRLRR